MPEAFDLVNYSSNLVPFIASIGLISKSYSYMHIIHLDHLLSSLVQFNVVRKEM
jgi:hypothetical protein